MWGGRDGSRACIPGRFASLRGHQSGLPGHQYLKIVMHVCCKSYLEIKLIKHLIILEKCEL